jgi:hypothetical protein
MDAPGRRLDIITPNKSLGTILLFPGRRHGGRDQQQERETTPLARSNDQLVNTLERLSDSYRALLVGERMMDAEEILAEVSNALITAARAGNG